MPWFWKKRSWLCPIFFHSKRNYNSIYEKKLQNVSLQGFFFVFDEIFIEVQKSRPENFLVACLHSGIIHFTKHSILNVLQCSEDTSDPITAHQFVQWPYAMYCIRHIQNFEIFRTLFCRYNQAYSSIFSIIKAYSCILKHY